MSPSRRSALAGAVAVCLTVPVFAASTALAQRPDVKLNDLISETQKDTPDPDRVTMVWWLPDEYWEVVLQEEAAEALSVVGPYVIIGAVDGKIGPFGGITFETETSVRNRLRLVDGEGRAHTPLAEDQVSPDARSLLAMMRPVLGNALGAMGENFHFFVFAGGEGGGAHLSATEEGSFSVFIGDEEFAWRLPLGSLLPPKFCPVDGEALSGAWKFCPWHGAALTPTKP